MNRQVLRLKRPVYSESNITDDGVVSGAKVVINNKYITAEKCIPTVIAIA